MVVVIISVIIVVVVIVVIVIIIIIIIIIITKGVAVFDSSTTAFTVSSTVGLLLWSRGMEMAKGSFLGHIMAHN